MLYTSFGFTYVRSEAGITLKSGRREEITGLGLYIKEHKRGGVELENENPGEVWNREELETRTDVGMTPREK